MTKEFFLSSSRFLRVIILSRCERLLSFDVIPSFAVSMHLREKMLSLSPTETKINLKGVWV